MTLQDALQNTLPVPLSPPQRIVSLVPSLTELLAVLGLDKEVVGVTRYCVHPEGWTTRKTCIGGTKKARIPSIRSLQPDLILANKEENIRHEVEALQDLCPVYVSDIATLSDSFDVLRDLGILTHRTHEATRVAQKIQHKLSTLQPLQPPQKAAYLIWRNPWMTVGHDTYIHDLMQHAGYINIFADQTRYPTTTLDEIAALHPETILLSTEPYPFKEEHVHALRKALHPLQINVQLVDGEAFSWYGARLLAVDALGDARFVQEGSQGEKG